MPKVGSKVGRHADTVSGIADEGGGKDRKEVDAVAEAWIQEGRRLPVVAVNLDCGNPVMLDSDRGGFATG